MVTACRDLPNPPGTSLGTDNHVFLGSYKNCKVAVVVPGLGNSRPRRTLKSVCFGVLRGKGLYPRGCAYCICTECGRILPVCWFLMWTNRAQVSERHRKSCRKWLLAICDRLRNMWNMKMTSCTSVISYDSTFLPLASQVTSLRLPFHWPVGWALPILGLGWSHSGHLEDIWAATLFLSFLKQFIFIKLCWYKLKKSKLVFDINANKIRKLYM